MSVSSTLEALATTCYMRKLAARLTGRAQHHTTILLAEYNGEIIAHIRRATVNWTAETCATGMIFSTMR